VSKGSSLDLQNAVGTANGIRGPGRPGLARGRAREEGARFRGGYDPVNLVPGPLTTMITLSCLELQGWHTPLSVEEEIPWRYQRLVIGTGTYGRLPVIEELKDEAQRRKIELLLLANRGGYPRAAERAQRCQCRASLDVLARLNPWPNRPMCLSRCWYLVAELC
jgi:hypothetical protein